MKKEMKTLEKVIGKAIRNEVNEAIRDNDLTDFPKAIATAIREWLPDEGEIEKIVSDSGFIDGSNDEVIKEHCVKIAKSIYKRLSDVKE